MSLPTNGNRLWLKILGPLIPMLLVGLIGYGTLRARVDGNTEALRGKASREVVETQNREVLRTLEALRQDISELRRVVVRQP